MSAAMAAGQRGDDRTPHLRRHHAHGLGIGVRGDGEPASMTSTPSVSSCRASCSFSSMRIENPGACSPSRSVVSKMISR